jgi:hypothetical protein
MPKLNSKPVKYLNRDFGTLREDLITFSKTYFPDLIQDFNESSPGMLFLEMSAYVGDVLSYYTDVQFKESLLFEAEERKNVLELAQAVGYQPKVSVPAQAILSAYQILPAIGSGAENRPDYRYAMIVEPGMVVGSSFSSNVSFNTIEYLDFTYSSSLSPTIVTVYEIDETTGDPTFYLLEKQVKASSGTVKEQEFIFTQPKPYDAVKLTDDNIIEIISATDSSGNEWTNVPYLSQETILKTVRNSKRNDPELYNYADETPYLLKLSTVPRRFTSRLLSDNSYLIQFGAGTMDTDDMDIIPNPDLVGSAFSSLVDPLPGTFDPSNFLYTKTYGIMPSNTTLNVRYRIGGGFTDNVESDILNTVIERNIYFASNNLDTELSNLVLASFAVNNPTPANGGRGAETLNEIKINALGFMNAQNRTVTKEDYIMRALTLPSNYGSISKCYITQDDQLNVENLAIQQIKNPNPLALNMYVLTYDKNSKLTNVNDATKENLKVYISSNRILTDAINIKNAYIINFGIDFDIVTLPSENNYDVILRCMVQLKNYFDITNWQINQPIVISEVYNILDRVPGVQTVVDVRFKNLFDSTMGYSNVFYDFSLAEKNGLIYPSLDPSIFEIKYPDTDIKGRVVGL